MTDKVKALAPWVLPLLTTVVIAVVSAIGLPRCSDLQTTAKAAEDHQVIEDKRKLDKEANALEHGFLKQQRAEIREDFKDLKKFLDKRLPRRGSK